MTIFRELYNTLFLLMKYGSELITQYTFIDTGKFGMLIVEKYTF